MEKPRILYVYDAMCGWCYGFSGIIQRISHKYSGHYDFIAVSGGMIVGEQIEPVSVMANYIKSAYPRVEALSGVKFGEPYVKLLDEGTYILNSIKPGIAMTVFKSYFPLQSIDFVHDLQKAHYREGKSLNEREVYEELVPLFGIDTGEFVERLNDEQFHIRTQEEFDHVKKLGINGFPTVLLENEQGLFMVSRGFRSYEEMEKLFEGMISGLAELED